MQNINLPATQYSIGIRLCLPSIPLPAITTIHSYPTTVLSSTIYCYERFAFTLDHSVITGDWSIFSTKNRLKNSNKIGRAKLAADAALFSWEINRSIRFNSLATLRGVRSSWLRYSSYFRYKNALKHRYCAQLQNKTEIWGVKSNFPELFGTGGVFCNSYRVLFAHFIFWLHNFVVGCYSNRTYFLLLLVSISGGNPNEIRVSWVSAAPSVVSNQMRYQ